MAFALSSLESPSVSAALIWILGTAGIDWDASIIEDGNQKIGWTGSPYQSLVSNRAIWNGDYRPCRSWRHLDAPTAATIGSASHLSSEPIGCPSSTLLHTQIVVALRSPSPLTVPSSADARTWPPKTETEMLVARSSNPINSASGLFAH
ncbi:hypothetical protein CGCF413_v008246 [Colletotrichum fructicola]|nr:hypothetical protein CGCF413_v008246 [Colletotrichum fructicola]